MTWIIQTVKWFLTRNSVRIIPDKEHTTSTASRLIAWSVSYLLRAFADALPARPDRQAVIMELARTVASLFV